MPSSDHQHMQMSIEHPHCVQSTSTDISSLVQANRSSTRTERVMPPSLPFLFFTISMLVALVDGRSALPLKKYVDTSQFSREELKQTFGVEDPNFVPYHHLTDPVLESDAITLSLPDSNEEISVHLRKTDNDIFASHAIEVYRFANGSTMELIASSPSVCHYRNKYLDKYLVAMSTCDGNVKGSIIDIENGVSYVIHPLPDRHTINLNKEKKRDTSVKFEYHVVYKRNTKHSDYLRRRKRQTENAENGIIIEYDDEKIEEPKFDGKSEFCGVESSTLQEMLIEDAGINSNNEFEDLAVIASKLTQESTLDAEVAVFIDELLYKKYINLFGSSARNKLKEYVATMFNNIQMIYEQPSMLPKLTFRITRYEVMSSTPSELAASRHSYGNAQRYLDVFCRYHSSLSYKNWDHGFLITGYDIHQGAHSKSISGIARLNGMCDRSNSCTLTEGMDFTSVFIGAHEMGHSVGMAHDEPYCSSNYIMSASLGPGKTTWSSCSMRDYHTFIRRLDQRRTPNCLRDTRLPIAMSTIQSTLPGQIYNADQQCELMHGRGYNMVKPRNEHPDGICYMMWCGKSNFGRIITSHPALEGTLCASGHWCLGGKCVTSSGGAVINRESKTNRVVTPMPSNVKTNGNWGSWSSVSCSSCSCQAPFEGAVGVIARKRYCNNPSPANGGSSCAGRDTMGIVCAANSCSATSTIDKYMSEVCTNHRSTKRDWSLTGSGAQLKRYSERACKIFCIIENKQGGPLNYRYYGDNLPDGTSCGTKMHCVDGTCLPLTCSNTALQDQSSCPTDKCSSANPLTSKKKPEQQAGRWSSWSQWSTCNVNCGGGTKRRARYCTVTGGCDGNKEERDTCNTAPCGSNWSQWSAWSDCSVTCGSGTKRRTRSCNGNACSGAKEDTEACNLGWCSWSAWSSCSVSCGQGSKVRQRSCPGNRCSGNTSESQICYQSACTSNTWGAWADWTGCSTTCGNGMRARYRRCNGNSCSGSNSERQSCSVQSCASGSARWSTWSDWNECSLSCGGGVKTRQRVCSNSGKCIGDVYDRSSCNNDPCDTIYENWGPWSLCSNTCGGGRKQRFRQCSRSASGNCKSDRELEACNEHPCSESIGSWSSWSAWSECTQSCGSGIERRRRNCSGHWCVGEDNEERRCYKRACAEWGGWGNWGSCNTNCGSGERKRVRNCYGFGHCEGTDEERQPCYGNRCG